MVAMKFPEKILMSIIATSILCLRLSFLPSPFPNSSKHLISNYIINNQFNKHTYITRLTFIYLTNTYIEKHTIYNITNIVALLSLYITDKLTKKSRNEKYYCTLFRRGICNSCTFFRRPSFIHLKKIKRIILFFKNQRI